MSRGSVPPEAVEGTATVSHAPGWRVRSDPRLAERLLTFRRSELARAEARLAEWDQKYGDTEFGAEAMSAAELALTIRCATLDYCRRMLAELLTWLDAPLELP